MREWPVTIIMLGSLATTAPAFALQATDTMSTWKTSTAKERSELLEHLFGKAGVGNAGLLDCMNETSKMAGHAALDIGDVAKVCLSAGNPDQPV